jgi:hypothetical protein
MMFVNSIEYDGLAAYELSKAQTFCGVPWLTVGIESMITSAQRPSFLLGKSRKLRPFKIVYLSIERDL